MAQCKPFLSYASKSWSVQCPHRHSYRYPKLKLTKKEGEALNVMRREERQIEIERLHLSHLGSMTALDYYSTAARQFGTRLKCSQFNRSHKTL